MSERTTQMTTTSGENAERTQARPVVSPAVDVIESKEALTIYADLPGVPEDKLNVTLDDGVLTIEGSQAFEAPKGYQLTNAEFRLVDYQRAFRLQEPVDESHIEAHFKDGVLTLTLPKARPKAKRIAVKVG